MITHICIIRGINVWWHNKITMDTLAWVFVGLRFAEVHTYIQSGNILFHSDEQDGDRLTDMITHAINHQLQVDVQKFITQFPMPGFDTATMKYKDLVV